MKRLIRASQLHPFAVSIALVFSFVAAGACAQTGKTPALTVLPRSYGRYSGHFLTGGIGLTKPLPAADPLLTPEAPWTLSAWIKFSQPPTESMLIAGAGDPLDEDSRFFVFVDGKPALRFGQGHLLRSEAAFDGSGWHLLAASFDGNIVRFYVDGAEVAHGPLQAGPIQPELVLAPVCSPSITF